MHRPYNKLKYFEGAKMIFTAYVYGICPVKNSIWDDTDIILTDIRTPDGKLVAGKIVMKYSQAFKKTVFKSGGYISLEAKVTKEWFDLGDGRGFFEHTLSFPSLVKIIDKPIITLEMAMAENKGNSRAYRKKKRKQKASKDGNVIQKNH